MLGTVEDGSGVKNPLGEEGTLGIMCDDSVTAEVLLPDCSVTTNSKVIKFKILLINTYKYNAHNL